jgi:hypothetical protein
VPFQLDLHEQNAESSTGSSWGRCYNKHFRSLLTILKYYYT